MTGLVGWWPLNEDSGSTAYDLSGNENHGSLNGGIVQGVAGKGGLTSYSFDGSDDYISGLTSLESLFSSPPVTVSMWVNADAIPGGYAFDVYNGRWTIGNSTKSSNWFLNVYDGNSNNIADSGISIKNNWILLTGVQYSNGNIEFYVNGESKATAESGKVATNTPKGPEIGNQTEGSRFFPGNIADLRVYDRVLSSEEIQELYEWGNGDYARPLNDQNSSSAVARWAFDGDATDSWSDNDGAVNGATYVSDGGIRGGTYSFDGDDVISLPDMGNFSSVTISTWAQWDSFGDGDDDAVIHIDQNNSIQIRDVSGQLQARIYDGSNGNVVTGKEPKDNEWYHYVLTWNGSELRFYINSIFQGNTNVSNNYAGTNGNGIGAGYQNSQRFFSGKIDDVRIYDKALSPSEVFELYRWGTRGRDMRKLTVNSR